MVLILTAVYKPVRRYQKSIRESIKQRTSLASQSFDRMPELEQRCEKFRQLASQFGVSATLPYPHEVREFVAENSSSLFSDSDQLRTIIAQKIELAEDANSKLATTCENYEDTLHLYREFSREAGRANSRSLLDLADEIGERLRSDNLKKLIREHQWNDLRDFFNARQEDLRPLIQSARARSESFVGDDQPQRAEMSDYERACSVLGIPLGIGREKALQMYRTMALLWHPDILKGDDSRMKELNWAKDYITSGQFEKDSATYGQGK